MELRQTIRKSKTAPTNLTQLRRILDCVSLETSMSPPKPLHLQYLIMSPFRSRRYFETTPTSCSRLAVQYLPSTLRFRLPTAASLLSTSFIGIPSIRLLHINNHPSYGMPSTSVSLAREMSRLTWLVCCLHHLPLWRNMMCRIASWTF